MDKCTLLDIVVDYENKVKKQSMRLDYHFPVFSYVFNMEHHVLMIDNSDGIDRLKAAEVTE